MLSQTSLYTLSLSDGQHLVVKNSVGIAIPTFKEAEYWQLGIAAPEVERRADIFL